MNVYCDLTGRFLMCKLQLLLKINISSSLTHPFLYVYKFRVVANTAHAMGFVVLERGEIERRLMFKSFMSNAPYLANEMHLPQPAQNIVATCLLHLLNCLNASSSLIYNSTLLGLYNNSILSPMHSFDGKHRDGQKKMKIKAAPARPLHTPP
jgi:hypothetical protein